MTDNYKQDNYEGLHLVNTISKLQRNIEMLTDFYFMSKAEKVINENILVHALESKEYLHRHPEQTNFFQHARLTKTINKAAHLLPDNHCKILTLDVERATFF